MTEDPSKSDCEHLNMPQSIPRGLLRHIIPRLLYRQEMQHPAEGQKQN